MLTRGIDRGTAFDVTDAWKIHKDTRKVDEADIPNLRQRQLHLQDSLNDYRYAVLEDFGTNLTLLKQPKDFLTNRTFKDFSKEESPKIELDDVEDGKWYSSLERMRAHELKRSVTNVLSDVELPMPPKSGKLRVTDVGSRSNFFASVMQHQNPEQDWKSVDVKGHTLPAQAKPDSINIIKPFSALPPSDIVTLNSVMHHVGEIDDGSGKFDDKKVMRFIGTVRDALPDNGLVVVTEDFIGKEKEDSKYKNFIKGVDELFYPKALGNQKPSKEWVKMFEEKGFVLEKEEYPVHFNVVGFPVVETCLVFRKK